VSRRRPRWLWLGAGAATVVLAALLSGRADWAPVPLVVWSLVTSVVVVRAAWRRLTYRVGTRLFLSYLLLGVSPFLFCGAFGAAALYMAMGQYTSVRFGTEMQHLQWTLGDRCARIVKLSHDRGSAAAIAALDDAAAHPPDPLPRVIWLARLGQRELSRPGGTGLPLPDWITGARWSGMARHGDEVFAMVAATAPGGDLVAALIPLDTSTAEAVGGSSWFDVAFVPPGGPETMALTPAGKTVELRVGETHGQPVEIWGPWRRGEASWLARPLVIWLRVATDVRDLASGTPSKPDRLVSLLRTSPRNVWDDFVLSRYELADALEAVLLGLGLFFLTVYAVAVLLAGLMIVSIARSTARLSRGAREVANGHLDWRIPVKRHDQLGDLAASFNGMAGSVQRMLVEVAAKEHLAHELELAREIQEGLLPDREMRVGAFEATALLRPAAEVGGDTFDFFPVGEGRMLVAVGDVAGHGLPTGLLMASLKSAVAALVPEGYTGEELLERVNRVLRSQSRKRVMATLLVAELDIERGEVRLASAGHPPPYLVTPGGEVIELTTSALPLGGALGRPATRTDPFPPGSRLVLYSDGLPEAADADGELLGYEAIVEVVAVHAGDTPGAMVDALVRRVEAHTGGAALADDLTVVVVVHHS
jgi:serine phosphatase RsbU (regulator of sigma subunit)